MEFLERMSVVREGESASQTRCCDLREDLVEEIDRVTDTLSDDGLGFDEIQKKKQEVTVHFLEKLRSSPESFRFIFETEKGSVYFISHSGDSWRFKKEKGIYREQPTCRKIVFIPEEEKEKYLQLQRAPLFEETLTDYDIKKAKTPEGSFPLEIGLEGFPDFLFEEDAEKIRILGTKIGDGVKKSFSSGIHLGHRIVKIIKA